MSKAKFYIAMQYVDGLSLQQAKAELTLNEKSSSSRKPPRP